MSAFPVKILDVSGDVLSADNGDGSMLLVLLSAVYAVRATLMESLQPYYVVQFMTPDAEIFLNVTPEQAGTICAKWRQAVAEEISEAPK